MFSIDPETAEKMAAWQKEHDTACTLKDDVFGGKACGAIGGRWTWKFTPTSIGCIVKLSCACGEEQDFTDTESW